MLSVQMKILLYLFILCLTSIASAQIVDHNTLALWNYESNSAKNYDANLCSGSVKPSEAVYQTIRSIDLSKEIADARYRFTLGKEVYAEILQAELRLKEISEPQKTDSMHSKMCNIRRAFQSRNIVYFVHTDVGAYRDELKNVADLLSAFVTQAQ